MRSEMSPNEQFFPEKDNVNPNAEIIPEQIPAAGSEKHGGPRTRQGKENSKKNSLKHGIFSRVLLEKGESRAQLNDLLMGFRGHFKPVGALEDFLLDKITMLIWRHRRLIIHGFVDMTPELSMRYEASLDRGLERALDQLDRAQRTRRGQPVLPPINLNIAEC
jgi:hypothetical protein